MGIIRRRKSDSSEIALNSLKGEKKKNQGKAMLENRRKTFGAALKRS